MTYEEYVLDVFMEHHLAAGQDLEEIKDVIREASFKKIEKWLTKIGYDLSEYNLL